MQKSKKSYMHCLDSKGWRLLHPFLVIFAAAFVSLGYDNLDYGMPTSKTNEEALVVIDREGYAAGYSPSKKQAVWVQYRLTAEEAFPSNAVKRSDCFDADPLLSDGVSEDDYKRSGYDRGHLAPAADMSWSKKAMQESFYMSNMSPQVPSFNRGIWKKLEDWTRHVALAETSIIVVTGSIFNSTNATASGIAVPSAYFKVIYDETPPCKAIGFLLSNEASTNDLSSFAKSVSEVEDASSFMFLQVIDASSRSSLWKDVYFEEWHLK